MDLGTLTKTVLRSGTARLLSGSVLLALLAVQLVFIVPAVVSDHHASIRALSSLERTRLQAALRYSARDELAARDALLAPPLVALVLSDADGQILLTLGDGTAVEGAGSALPWTGAARLVEARWWLDTEDEPVNAAVTFDTSDVWKRSALHALALLGFAMVASLVGALFALIGTARYHLRPLDELATLLRDSRMASEGGIPDAIEFTDSDDLAVLATEFNSLIEAQKKSARQVKVKQQYLEFAAHHDTLTHLPNRLMFEDTLKATVREAVADDLQFAVFLVDLDNFKFFNDQYGHLVGDKMVAEVGNRLRTMMRDIDLVARLDGDEFVVIQKDVPDRASAEEVAKRLMGVATAPYEYRGFTLKAAVSVGISCFPLDVHGEQAEEMLGEEIVNNAAVALQEAKSNGKNQYQLFNESMRSRLTARIRLEQDLKVALAEGQFEVFYQPKINIHTRAVTGAEALVRWRHPVNGFISPEIFVPVAEEAGMIIELGEWILRTACRQTHELHMDGYPGLNVAVNISAMQFTDGNLLPMVSRALADTSLAPELLELEITESAVMHDPEEVIHSLHELSRFGMRLAIDDFGTGYSSLAYLKRFPVDTLKIDRAFITDISSDNDDVAIVEAVLGLGKHFGMKVVAEGVEDEEQLQFLKDQGCDIAQGYFISKPMCLEEYQSWLQRWPYGMHAQSPTSLEAMDPAPFLKVVAGRHAAD
mgnify:CR=1 FL=1